MLSHRLVQLVEEHYQTIVTQVIDRIREEPELAQIQTLPETELEIWCCNILRNLGTWLDSKDQDMAHRYEDLGRLRFEEAVPLHEAVRGLQILKSRTIDYIRERGFSQSAVEVYAEEELEHRVNRFFDWLTYHLVRGYETALRRAAHMAS